MRSIILAYAWSVPLAVIAFLSSRGVDGDLGLFAVGFGLVGMAYVLHNWATPGGVSRHHLGHAIVFCVLVVIASLIDSKLDGMAGMMYLIMPVATLGIVLIAVVGVGVKKYFSGDNDDTAS